MWDITAMNQNEPTDFGRGLIVARLSCARLHLLRMAADQHLSSHLGKRWVNCVFTHRSIVNLALLPPCLSRLFSKARRTIDVGCVGEDICRDCSIPIVR